MRRRASLLWTVLLVACAKGPEPVAWGRDVCQWCSMGISDPHFAAELRTDKGKLSRFDSIECLAAYAVVRGLTEANTEGRWVTDYATQKWLPAGEAFYLRSPRLHSPMGLDLTAFATRKELEAQREKTGGEMLEWQDVTTLVQATGFVRSTNRLGGR